MSSDMFYLMQMIKVLKRSTLFRDEQPYYLTSQISYLISKRNGASFSPISLFKQLKYLTSKIFIHGNVGWIIDILTGNSNGRFDFQDHKTFRLFVQ